ncbi:hypothetical protein BY458DRAFT_528871 [Sporodiniella umbellata]|nr:hypothetical protein BY458DRAFT_528871 [Sporodiniella umbellata]
MEKCLMPAIRRVLLQDVGKDILYALESVLARCKGKRQSLCYFFFLSFLKELTYLSLRRDINTE